MGATFPLDEKGEVEWPYIINMDGVSYDLESYRDDVGAIYYKVGFKEKSPADQPPMDPKTMQVLIDKQSELVSDQQEVIASQDKQIFDLTEEKSLSERHYESLKDKVVGQDEQIQAQNLEIERLRNELEKHR